MMLCYEFLVSIFAHARLILLCLMPVHFLSLSQSHFITQLTGKFSIHLFPSIVCFCLFFFFVLEIVYFIISFYLSRTVSICQQIKQTKIIKFLEIKQKPIHKMLNYIENVLFDCDCFFLLNKMAFVSMKSQNQVQLVEKLTIIVFIMFKSLLICQCAAKVIINILWLPVKMGAYSFHEIFS